MTLDNLLALVLLPLVGVISDRTHTRIGKRMPYILIGVAAAAVFLIFMPILYNVGSFIRFFIMLGGLLLAMSIYRSPAVALMPDVTPKPLRSRANAIINLMGAAGSIIILVATTVIGSIAEARNDDSFYTAMFLFTAITIVVAIVVMFFTVDENKLVSIMPHEPENDDEGAHPQNIGQSIHSSAKTSLIFLLIAVALWYMAYGCIETNFSRYAVDILKMNEATKAIPMLVATISTLICFAPLGILSSKLGRKKTIFIGLGVLLAAALLSAVVKNIIVLYVLFALIGISWAAINVNSYPMVVEMAKDSDIGKYTGYYYTFQMAAQIATPLLSGVFIDIFNNIFGDPVTAPNVGMNAMFPYAAVFLVLSIVAMIFVNHGDIKDSDVSEEEKALIVADQED
jgi:Na+/melibiose symporter-like transporter